MFVKKGEEKFMLLDLKYTMGKQVITFFTESLLGNASLSADVYSEANPRCPSQFDGDFSFGRLETQIQLQSIKQKLKQNKMETDHDIYLCLLASSITDSKFTIEYSSDEQTMKVLTPNTFERIQLSADQVKMYQMQANQQY